jgi:hypothetical protein
MTSKKTKGKKVTALSGNVNNASINGGFRSDDFSVRSAG